MKEKANAKRLLSMLLAFAMVFSIVLPATAAEEGTGKKLFARWSDGSGFLDSHEMPWNLSSPLVFCFGTSTTDYVEIPLNSTALTATGVVQLTPAGSMDGSDNVYRITLSGEGTGTVRYTHEGIVYEFSVVGKEAWTGDSTGNGKLYAVDTTSNKKYESLEIAPGNSVYVYLETDNGRLTHDDVSKIAVPQFFDVQAVPSPMWENAFMISASGTNTGAILYTDGDVMYELPVTSADGSGSSEDDGTPKLFAKWPDGSGFLFENGLPCNMMSPVVFCFGTQDSYVELPLNCEALSTSGVAVISPYGTLDGKDNVYSITVTGEGEGFVIYTVDGVSYSFRVEGQPAWNEEPGPGGSGGSGSDTGNTRLFARWASTPSSYMDYLKIPAGETSPIEFCFGTTDSYEVIPQNSDALTAEEGLIFEAADCPVFTTDRHTYNVGNDRIGIGAVTYTVDGVEYKFYVIGTGEPMGTDTTTKLFARWPDQSGFVYSLELYQDMSSPLEFCFGTTSDYTVIPLNDPALQAGGVVKLTPMGGFMDTPATATYDVAVEGAGPGAVVYTADGVTYEMPVLGLEGNFSEDSGGSESGPVGPNDSWRDEIVGTIGGAPNGGTEVYGPNPVVINHDGKEVSVGIGMFQMDTQTVVYGFGDSYNDDFTHRFAFEFILVALENHGTDKETPASQDFLNHISDVEFYIPYWYNEDGSTDVSNCMLSSAGEPFAAGDVTTWRTFMVADNGKGFNCTLAMDFTYTPEDGEPQRYTVTSGGHYTRVEQMLIHADDPNGAPGAYLDTAEKLNAVLSSRENLEVWLQEYFPEEFTLYYETDDLTLFLPAVEYEDVIVVNCPMPDGQWGIVPSVHIFGAFSGYDNKPLTKMPGFLNKGGHGSIQNVHFIGNKNDKIRYGNKSFTCGVLIDGPDGVWNDMINVGNCIFENLEYGIYDTPTGYHGCTSSCEFINCEYGLYIDCKGKSGATGGANDEHTYNTFRNCKFAVWVKSLPEYITPYMLRVVDNTFLQNKHDIKVTTPGRNYYYFYRNYYYGTYDEVSVHSDAQEGRAAIVDTENSGAIVLTSPARRYQHDNTNLWVYDNNANVLNGEADSLQIDQNALTGLTEDVEISVIGDASSGKTVAIWTFEAEGGTQE